MLYYFKLRRKNMEIKKNYKLNELINIFDENNQGFVYDKNCITNDEFIKYVYVEKNQPIGYLVLYPRNDFAIKDGYDIKVTIPENSIYIWHIITKKGYEGRGIAKTLINFLKKEYKNQNIYSIIDEHNIRSKKLHESLGFLPVDKFKKAYKDTMDSYTLVKFDSTLKCTYPTPTCTE